MTRGVAIWIALTTLLFLGVFLVWPLAYVFQGAFRDVTGFTLTYMRDLLLEERHLESVFTSLWIGVLVTGACLAVALPMAVLVARFRFPGRDLLSGVVLVPLILPPFVGAVGLKMLFARFGALSVLMTQLGLADGPVDWLGAYPLLGVVAMETLHLFPVLYLNLVAALANIDPTLEEAALNLGASPRRVFWRVTLPLAAPGLFAGMILVFIWSFTELGTPLIFGVRDALPVRIYDRIGEVGTNPMGYAQVVLLLAVAVSGFWVSKRVARGRGDVANLGRLSVAGRDRRLSPAGVVAAWVGMGLVLGLAMLPHASVVLLSVSRRWFYTVLPEGWTLEFYARAIGSEATQTALRNSLGLSLAATAVALALGFGVAWACVRARMRGSDWLDALAMLPLAVPGLVIAFGYLGCFSGNAALAWLDPRKNPMALLAIAYAIRRLPFVVRAVHAGLEQTSRVYEEAAANLGASPGRVIRRVTLPLISANLLAGGILCFTFSMLEVSESMILAQSERFYPITKAIYAWTDSLEYGANVASALGVWAMALLGTAMVWTSLLMGKKMGQMFRAG